MVMLVQMFTRDNPDYRFLLMSETVYASEQLDLLENLLAQYGEDLDGDGKVEVNIQSCLYGDDASLKHNSGPQIVSAHLAAGDILFFIWDEDAYKYFTKSVENVSAAGEDFFSDIPVEVAGVLENGKAYCWEEDARREGILTDFFSEKLYFAVRAPIGSAAGSTQVHDQSMALMEKFLEGAKAVDENADGADTAVSTTMTTATEETTTTTQGSSASSVTATEPTTTQKTTEATEKVTSTTATTTKATEKPTTTKKATTSAKKTTAATTKKTTAATEKTTKADKDLPYIDPRVKIEKSLVSKTPTYSLNRCYVLDTRTWGERPSIEVYDGKNLKVTYYNKQGKEVTFKVEYPGDSLINQFVILDDGTYVSQYIGSYS